MINSYLKNLASNKKEEALFLKKKKLKNKKGFSSK
jgi:hypothetical protein